MMFWRSGIASLAATTVSGMSVVGGALNSALDVPSPTPTATSSGLSALPLWMKVLISVVVIGSVLALAIRQSRRR